MDKTTGLLIICSANTISNETGSDHFDIAPGITVDCVRDMSEFLAPFAREEWKVRVGSKRWETHIDPDWCEQKWVVCADGEKAGEAAALAWPSRYWQALKIATSFRSSISAYLLCCRTESGIYHPYECGMEQGWHDTQHTGENILSLSREIFDRWMDFAAKLNPLHKNKKVGDRSDRFTTGVDLFCRGLQEHDIRHRLNCFILALEALLCSSEVRQRESFMERIKCFWPQDQSMLLSPKKLAPIINNIFFLKSRLDHLKDLGDGDTVRKSYWWIVLQAEQLTRSAYSAVLSSPEHYKCFTDIQRQQAFWASRNNRILFQRA